MLCEGNEDLPEGDLYQLDALCEITRSGFQSRFLA